MDYKNIMERLEGLKSQLLELKRETHTKGRTKFEKISQEYSMIIRRIYSEQERINYIVGSVPSICNKANEEEQEEYLRDIDSCIGCIDLIKREFDLFGFEDFTPLKKKTEIEISGGYKDIFGRFKWETNKKKK